MPEVKLPQDEIFDVRHDAVVFPGHGSVFPVMRETARHVPIFGAIVPYLDYGVKLHFGQNHISSRLHKQFIWITVPEY